MCVYVCVCVCACVCACVRACVCEGGRVGANLQAIWKEKMCGVDQEG